MNSLCHDLSRQEDLFQIFLQFIECWIHCILYMRQIYPPELFRKDKYFGVPTYKSCHPRITNYIRNVVLSIRNDLFQHSIKSINLFICTVQGRIPMEKFVLELIAFQSNTTNVLKGISKSQEEMHELESAFRACLLKLNLSDSLLAPLPEGVEFTFFVTVQVAAATGENERMENVNDSSFDVASEERKSCLEGKFPWLKMKKIDVALACEKALLIPLKSVCLFGGEWKFQLWVEEDCEMKRCNV